MDFPQLTMTLPDGREESIMKRTTLVCCLPASQSHSHYFTMVSCKPTRPMIPITRKITCSAH